jgi:hypothetical protein
VTIIRFSWSLLELLSRWYTAELHDPLSGIEEYLQGWMILGKPDDGGYVPAD